VQAGESIEVDRPLPALELLQAQRIAGASIVERQQSAANGGNDLCLSPDHPSLGVRRGQIDESQA
jgi:hypothetical protein